MLRALLLLISAVVVVMTTAQELDLEPDFLYSPEQLLQRMKTTTDGYYETTVLNPSNYDPTLNCECVSHELCKADGFIDTDGTAGIGVKGMVERNVHKCTEPEIDSSPMVCCKIPMETSASTASPRLQFHSTCGKRWTGLDLKIVGGQDASEAEFPWMTLLLESTNNTNLFACGASLIHPRVVLTAAHCIKHLVPDKYTVRVGEHIANWNGELSPHQDRKVSEILIPSTFNARSLHNDIALLVLRDAVNPAKNVGTICLPEHHEKYDREMNCVATGWGKDGFLTNNTYQSTLRKSLFDMMPGGECQVALRKSNKLGNYFILNPSFTCAKGKEGTDTCRGDGGGPLVCQKRDGQDDQFVEVGITAWGVGCGLDFPGVYSDVAFNRPWIDAEMSRRGFQVNAGFY